MRERPISTCGLARRRSGPPAGTLDADNRGVTNQDQYGNRVGQPAQSSDHGHGCTVRLTCCSSPLCTESVTESLPTNVPVTPAVPLKMPVDESRLMATQLEELKPQKTGAIPPLAVN